MNDIILNRIGIHELKKPWIWHFKYHAEDKIYEMYDDVVGLNVFNFTQQDCIIELEEEIEHMIHIQLNFPNKTSEDTIKRIEKMSEFVNIDNLRTYIKGDVEKTKNFCENCKKQGEDCEFCMWYGYDCFVAKDSSKEVSPYVTIQREIEEELGYPLGESSKDRMRYLLQNGFTIKEIIDYFKLF